MPDKNVEHEFKDGYWLTIISLLKFGLPWELIASVSDEDMIHVLATVQTIHDYEQELQERETRQSAYQQM